jgi:hypothetical protein
MKDNLHKTKKLHSFLFLFTTSRYLILKRMTKFALSLKSIKEAPSNDDQQNFNPH